MPNNEASFEELDSVPVHYDRLPAPNGYGSKGQPYKFYCRNKLKKSLEDCMKDLFSIWNKEKPSIILSAGTLGDGENAHGRGYAFDLDGFYWGDSKFMMDDYKDDRKFYNGINSHLFLYFSQVLSYFYPNHRDHFHMDFNFSYKFRTASNSQTLFLQSALVYVHGQEVGTTGEDDDGVDGVYGEDTKRATRAVLEELGLDGQGGLTNPDVWKEFLLKTRAKAFE